MAALSILTVKFVAIGLSKELAETTTPHTVSCSSLGSSQTLGSTPWEYAKWHGQRDRASVLGALVVIRSVILILSLALAIALIWILPQWRGTPLPLSVTFASLVPLFTLLAGILRTVFQVHYRMQFVFVAEVTQRVITTGLIGLFIVAGARTSSNTDILYAFLLIGGIGAFVLF